MRHSRTDSWQPSPSHLRAVSLGVLGVAGALLFRVPILLVLATPFAFVAVWSVMTRPHQRLDLSTALSPRTIREGEATTWTGRFDAVSDHDAPEPRDEMVEVDGVDHVIAFVPCRAWLETRPRSGVVATSTTASGAPVAAAIAIRGTHWGPHEVGPINVVAVSSWGAFRWKAIASRHPLTTLPLPEVFDAAASRHRANGLVGIDRSGHTGDGSEFSGIRPFQTGDRLRRINWQRSLRNGELHVTSTYSDQDSHVALFVDALADFGPSEGIDGAASSLDTSVRAAGAIAEHFLLRGDRVSLHVFGSRGRATVPAGSGRSHLRRILDRLAMLEPAAGRTGAARVSRAAIPGDALAIMLSPLISPIALERAATIVSHGLTAAVVDTLPADVHDGDDATTELAWRIRLLERRREVRVIEEIGVPVIAWRGPGSLDPFLPRTRPSLRRTPDGSPMNAEQVQGWIDELHATSWQQWALRVVVLLAPLGALAAVTAEVGRWWPLGAVLVPTLAIASAFRPDSHTALIVIVIVAWHVLATVDRVDTPWVAVAACCLLLYHSVVALTATFPVGGVVPTATLLGWAQRTGLAGGLTTGMWALVIVMERRDAAGNGLLTALAVAIVAASAVLIRLRSLDG